MLALLLAAQLLMETSQLFAETSGEATDAPVPLVISRIRGDVQGAAGAYREVAEDGSLIAVTMVGGPGGRIVYTKQGVETSTVVPEAGDPPGPPTVLARGHGLELPAGTGQVGDQPARSGGRPTAP